MTDHLMPFMLFSRTAGSEAGAVLIFAHDRQEARVVGWRYIAPHMSGEYSITDEYRDLGVRGLADKPWLFEDAHPDMLAVGEPHLNYDPKSCTSCLMWGQSPIGEDGLCESCREGIND